MRKGVKSVIVYSKGIKRMDYYIILSNTNSDDIDQCVQYLRLQCLSITATIRPGRYTQTIQIKNRPI
mgnify:CR=1 FL=1